MAEVVSIGVPVYKGANLVSNALRSIQAQTYKELDVLISVDGEDMESARACAPFLKDSRFRMVIQKRQRGWVGNISFLQGNLKGDYWYYHQQDDHVAPEYVETLLTHLQGNPRAAVAYCDIQCFGSISNQVVQTSIVGAPLTRQLTLMLNHHSAVAFRGLTRRDALLQCGGVPGNEVEDFSADTTWMASVARAGELHRVPGYLYFKNYHDKNIHTKWRTWPEEKRSRAWQIHCRDMFLECAKTNIPIIERDLLWHAAIRRLVSTKLARIFVPLGKFSHDDAIQFLEGFLEVFAGHEKFMEMALNRTWEETAKATRGDIRRFIRLPAPRPSV